MKPVLRTVVDKNGGEELVFTANSRMIIYATMRAAYPLESVTEVCARCNIDPQLPNRWKTKYGSHYTEWLEEAIDMMVDDDAKVLERVGMMQAAQGNFNFWREMAKTKGVIKEAEGPKSITINTDFSAIVVAGASFEDMRAQILQKARGILPSKAEPVTVEAEVVREPVSKIVPLKELEF